MQYHTYMMFGPNRKRRPGEVIFNPTIMQWMHTESKTLRQQTAVEIDFTVL